MDQPLYMEQPDDGMDVRAYIRVILSRWKLILGLAVVAGAVAALAGYLTPPSYEARVVVVATKPQYIVEFDSRIKTTDQASPAAKALISLATTDDVLSQVAASPSLAGAGLAKSAADLRAMLSAQAMPDPSMLALVVRGPDAQQAATIANAWAEVLVASARGLYGQGADDVAYFEAQLRQADESLKKAEAALVNFESGSELALRQGDLASLQRERQTYLAELEGARRLVASADALRQQLSSRPAEARVTPGDETTALLLQIEAFTPLRSQLMQADPPASTTFASSQVPVQLQIVNGQAASSVTVGDLRLALENLRGSLLDRSKAMTNRLGEIEPRVPQIQQQVRNLIQQQERLTLATNVARDTYQTVARKLDEARISALDGKAGIQIASHAAPPTAPSGPRIMYNAALAATAGFIVAVILVFALWWWRGENTAAATETGRPTPSGAMQSATE